MNAALKQIILSKKKTLYPRDVNGCVLSLIAKRAAVGLSPTLSSGASALDLFSDMSKYGNNCTMVNLAHTTASGFYKSPVLAKKGYGISYTNLIADGGLTVDANTNNVADTLNTSNAVGTFALSAGIQSFTATEVNGYLGLALDVITGNRYYAAIVVKANHASVKLRNVSNVTDTSKAHTGNSAFEKLSLITTATDTGQTLLCIQDYRASTWAVVQMKECMYLNLTTNVQAIALEAELGRELTAEECDRLFAFTTTSNYVVVGAPYALALDGTDDYGTFAAADSLDITTNEFAICATFRAASGAAAGYLIIRNLSTGADQQYGLLWQQSDKTVKLYLNGAVVKTTGTLVENTIYNIIFYKRATGVVYYLNKIGSTNAVFNTPLVSQPNLTIGARSADANGITHAAYFKGDIFAESVYQAPSLDINKIIQAEMNISYEYTGVK